jgi:hypothetical protein
MADLEKVCFRVEQDNSGYPPVQVEGLWARPFDQEKYILDNIPFFAKGVSWMDMIATTQSPDGQKWVTGVVSSSGHSTVRVIVFRDSRGTRALEEHVSELRKRFVSLGCSTELSHLPGLFAIDIPPDVPYSRILPVLEEGKVRDEWDYEEANLQHSLQG